MLVLCFILCVCVNNILCLTIIESDKNMEMLPNIFEMDEYEKCTHERDKYCELQIMLKPSTLNNNNTAMWKIIENTKYSGKYYDHGLLYYRKCIRNNSSEIINVYNDNFTKLGLYGNITNVHCTTDNIETLTSIYDIIFMFILCTYILFILYITATDITSNKLGVKKGNKNVMVAFSLRSNIKKLLETNKFPCKTKSIQGVRVITMLIIICMHTILHHFNSYIRNTDFLENVFLNPITYRIAMVTLHVVQIFFVISSFLLSIQVHEIYERSKKFNFKHLCILFFNRYIRLLPTIALIVGLVRSGIFVNFLNVGKETILDEQINACKSHWLSTLLMYNNEIIGKDICHPGTWYVATDTQLYLLALCLLYIKIKYNLKLYVVLGIPVVFSLISLSSIMYIQNLNLLYQIKPQYKLVDEMLSSYTFWALYKSTLTNLPTYMVGIYVGHIYFVNRNKMTFNARFKTILWWIISVGSVVMVAEISSREFPAFLSIIVGPVLKPLFGIGIGIMILTIINDDGLIKRACDSKLLQILSSVTYTTYNVHFMVVFKRNFSHLMHLSSYTIVTSFVEDAIWSMVLGALLHLLIELPMQNLQKMFIPQIAIKTKENYCYDKKHSKRNL